MSWPTTHGMTGTPTHSAWIEMRRRCKPGGRDSRLYAERGITVCDRWESFESFLADMGERPLGLQLDRIDNDRGYCRWVTLVQQRRNQRRTKLSPELVARIKGMEGTCRQIAAVTGVSRSAVSLVNRGEMWAEVG